MIQKLDDITDEGVGEALDRLGRHVPVGEEFGRPLVARRDNDAVMLMTTCAWW